MKISIESIGYHESKFRPMSDCTINIATNAFQYGTMVFGGVRGYYNNQKDDVYIFRLEDHIQRLFRGAHIMHMKPPLEEEETKQILLELAKRNKIKSNTYFRPFIYKSDLQLAPLLHGVGDNFSLYLLPLNDYLDTTKGLKLCISSWRRIDENVIPARVKSSGAYINSALAKSEALQNGYDEAIFLDTRGFVSEGSAENIFIVRDKTLITPSLASSVLEGITRCTLIQLAQDLSIPFIERDIARGELYMADEVFLCGTGAQVAWVSQVDRRRIGDGKIGPITKKLRHTFIKAVTGNSSNYQEWLTPVYGKN